MKITSILLFIIAITSTNAYTQQLPVIPQPNQVAYTTGTFMLASSVQLVTKHKQLLAVTELIQYLNAKTKLIVATKPSSKYNQSIHFNIQDTSTTEAYSIVIAPTVISITASKHSSYYAYTTLVQLLQHAPPQGIPCCSIQDTPRFAYRGMHLDVARHYYPVATIKQYLNDMARYKYNTFHWHLTDDQGWRIEIKKYPKLTQVGAIRNGTLIGRYPGTGTTNMPYGGYYTQQQIREVVAYAAKRNITVIPEIEMPGHSSAAIAAYPQLSCFPDTPTYIPGKHMATASKHNTSKLVQETWGIFPDVYAPTEYTFNFLQNVLAEVMELFPSKYIHIGGDECPKENWKKSAFCQQLIKDNNLKDEHGLQSYFIQRIEKYLNKNGRNMIGWDEILEGGLAPNATVMSWRGEKGGIQAAKESHTVIMTPSSHMYFDHAQYKPEDSITIGGHTSVEKVYSYEPIPSILTPAQAQYIIGAQANVWTEYINNESKLNYMLYPRIIALSEVLWSSKTSKTWDTFKPRLASELALRHISSKL